MPANNRGVRIGWLAGRFPGRIGHLFSPGGERGPYDFIPYVLDNGVFALGDAWNEDKWLRLLDWSKMSGQAPQWVLVPDVVGNAIATLQKWRHWHWQVRKYGWPLAFAVQDGMNHRDVPAEADVLFVGGTTEWKWRTAADWCARFPRVHIGRVNSYERLWQCDDMGAESCDGTGWTRGDQVQYRGLLAYLEESAGLRQRPEQLRMVTA